MIFIEVPSKPHFSVSEDQRVCWTKTGTVLSHRLDKDGYIVYSYRINGKTYHISLHRAVAEVFVHNPNPSKFKIVNHKNGIRTDCSPPNLEWTDYKGNRIHCQVTGNHCVKGERHSQAKITEDTANRICSLLSEGATPKVISDTIGIKRHIVVNISRGLSWRWVAEKYGLNIPPKPVFNKKTMSWLIDEVKKGNDIKPFLAANSNISEEDKILVLSVIEKEAYGKEKDSPKSTSNNPPTKTD